MNRSQVSSVFFNLFSLTLVLLSSELNGRKVLQFWTFLSVKSKRYFCNSSPALFSRPVPAWNALKRLLELRPIPTQLQLARCVRGACSYVLSVSSNYHKSGHKKPQLVILLLVLWPLAAEGREGEHASTSMIWTDSSSLNLVHHIPSHHIPLLIIYPLLFGSVLE